MAMHSNPKEGEKIMGPIFVHFFLRKISGKIPRKIFTQNVGKKWNFPRKKFWKIVFPRNSAESDFPWKKMYEKSAPGANRFTARFIEHTFFFLINSTRQLTGQRCL
jgi:hypothetical protein